MLTLSMGSQRAMFRQKVEKVLPQKGRFPRSALLVVAAVLCVSLLMAAGAGFASGAQGRISAVRFGGDQARTRVVLDMSQGARGEVVETGTSGRVVLSLAGVAPSNVSQGRGLGLVRGFQLGAAGSATRVELSLAADAEVERRFLLPPGDGVPHFRYVIDLKARNSGGATPAPAPVAASQPRASAPRRNERPIIVIDAGHGGNDIGARGAAVNESAVTLAAARALKAELERNGRYRVVMTRDSDVYVQLPRRVAIARNAGADLFISLHADAGADPATRGASVYTLSEQGASRAVRQVTNRADWFQDLHLPGHDPSVDRILLDMTQRATQNRSAQFARVLLSHIEAADHPMLGRSHRDAGFAVLLAPDVPAVLLEMGFITNPEDERVLTDERRRNQLMRAVAQGIDRYFTQPATTHIAAAGGVSGGTR
jgi:N-acetylmuramoyl-L-alanine amidase